MTIPNIYLLQAVQKNLKMAKVYQEDLSANFFKHTMYGVKDALSTILAICDMEKMKGIDQVKTNIQKVNDMIENVHLYHNSVVFNVKHIIENVMTLVQDNYRKKLDLDIDVTLVEALAEGNQVHFEQSILYVLLQALESSTESSKPDKPFKATVKLSRRDQEAYVSIHFQDYSFEEIVRKELMKFINDHSVKILIHNKGNTAEAILRVPLSMGAGKSAIQRATSSSISLKSKEAKSQGVKV